MMRVLFAVIALAAGLLVGCRECGGPRKEPIAEAEPVPVPFWDEHRKVVAGLDVHDAFRYFSGQIKTSGNHPAMYADIKAGTLVVTGRGLHRVFENRDLDGAIAAYQKLLVDTGHVPEDEKDAGDPNRMVVVLLDDILPSEEHVLKVFSPEQNDVLKHVTTSTGFKYLSGNEGGVHDNPAVYSVLLDEYTLVVVGRGSEEMFGPTEWDRAFDTYRALLTKRGFKIAEPDASPDGG